MPRSPSFASATAVQDAFYTALAHADLTAVMTLWADDEEVVCVHPGGPRLVGLHAVRQSFEEILAHGPVHIVVRNIQAYESATLSVHNLVETITVSGARGTERIDVLTTNVYVKNGAGWQLLVHHATPGQEIERPANENPSGKLH